MDLIGQRQDRIQEKWRGGNSAKLNFNVMTLVPKCCIGSGSKIFCGIQIILRDPNYFAASELIAPGRKEGNHEKYLGNKVFQIRNKIIPIQMNDFANSDTKNLSKQILNFFLQNFSFVE